MSSYPRTPPGSAFGDSISIRKGVSKDDQTQVTDHRATLARSAYIPRTFNLVYPAGDAVSSSENYIPPVFFEAEAINSSMLLGHGASFTAILQEIPVGPKTVEVTTHLPGWSETSVSLQRQNQLLSSTRLLELPSKKPGRSLRNSLSDPKIT